MRYYLYSLLLLHLISSAAIKAQTDSVPLKPIPRSIDTLRARLESTGSIGGQITISGSSRTPANVHIALSDERNVTRSAVAGASGNYLFAMLEPASYSVRVTTPGFEPEVKFVEVYPSRHTKADIHLVPDYRKSSFHKTGGIVGLVLDSLSRKAVMSPVMSLVGPDLTIEGDMSGRFAIYDLQPGLYIVRVSALGYRTSDIDSVVVRTSQATSITVLLPQTHIYIR
jgi:hypothetical protein